MPPLFGLLAEATGFILFPQYLLAFLLITACTRYRTASTEPQNEKDVAQS